MAEYRAVQCAFWQDPFILDLTPEEKYFYLYLITNPKTTQCGAYELPVRVMEMETGYNRETVIKLLDRFTEYGKIRYDKGTCEIILLNWLRHNWIGSEKVIKRIQKDTVSIKNHEFRDHINTILIGYGYGIGTVPEKEKEKEKEIKHNPPIIPPEKTEPTSKRKTALPEDYPLTDAMRTWVQAQKLSVDVDREHQRFINHHIAKGTRYVDWYRAWQNWMTGTFVQARASPRRREDDDCPWAGAI